MRISLGYDTTDEVSGVDCQWNWDNLSVAVWRSGEWRMGFCVRGRCGFDGVCGVMDASAISFPDGMDEKQRDTRISGMLAGTGCRGTLFVGMWKNVQCTAVWDCRMGQFLYGGICGLVWNRQKARDTVIFRHVTAGSDWRRIGIFAAACTAVSAGTDGKADGRYGGRNQYLQLVDGTIMGKQPLDWCRRVAGGHEKSSVHRLARAEAE